MTDSDLRSLEIKEKKYKKSTGEGLLVLVYPNGSKYFVWEYQFPPVKDGKRKTYHIGKYGKNDGEWSLAAARDEKRRLDAERKKGNDPQLLKSTHKESIVSGAEHTFGKVATEWMGMQTALLAKTTVNEYRNMLDYEILPVFENRPIISITREECLKIHEGKVRKGKKERARKILMTMKLVFDYAMDKFQDKSWIMKINPARASKLTRTGHKAKPLPSLTTDWNKVKDFLVAVTENKCRGEYVTNIAVKVGALTFLRATSLVSPRWSDIDFDKKMWTVPDYAMKGRENTGKHHLVPMSPPLIELFEKLKALNGDEEYCFYSARGKTTPYINSSSPNHHIKNLGYEGKMTTHGFRSMAMTYGMEKLGFSYEIIDLQLGHIKGDKIRQAYDRAQFIDERIDFMNKWSELLIKSGLGV